MAIRGLLQAEEAIPAIADLSNGSTFMALRDFMGRQKFLTSIRYLCSSSRYLMIIQLPLNR